MELTTFFKFVFVELNLYSHSSFYFILEGSEGDAEVVFKEVNEVLSGEGSLHVIPGVFSR